MHNGIASVTIFEILVSFHSKLSNQNPRKIIAFYEIKEKLKIKKALELVRVNSAGNQGFHAIFT